MLWLQHSTPNQQGLCLNTKSLVFKLKTVGTGNSDTGLYINMGIIFPHCDFGWQTFFTVSFSFSFNTTYLTSAPALSLPKSPVPVVSAPSRLASPDSWAPLSSQCRLQHGSCSPSVLPSPACSDKVTWIYFQPL